MRNKICKTIAIIGVFILVYGFFFMDNLWVGLIGGIIGLGSTFFIKDKPEEKEEEKPLGE